MTPLSINVFETVPNRNEDQEALVMFLMASMVTGILMVLVAVQGYKLFRRHVLKIPDKPKSFVMDKKVKCKSGEQFLGLIYSFIVTVFLFLFLFPQATT